MVYHANYLKFCERARNLLLADHGCSFEKLLSQDIVLAVVAVEMRYSRPLRMQPIWIVTRTVDASNKAVTIRHVILTSPPNEEDLHRVADEIGSLPGAYFVAEYRLVCTTLSTLKARSFSGELSEALNLTKGIAS